MFRVKSKKSNAKIRKNKEKNESVSELPGALADGDQDTKAMEDEGDDTNEVLEKMRELQRQRGKFRIRNLPHPDNDRTDAESVRVKNGAGLSSLTEEDSEHNYKRKKKRMRPSHSAVFAEKVVNEPEQEIPQYSYTAKDIAALRMEHNVKPKDSPENNEESIFTGQDALDIEINKETLKSTVGEEEYIPLYSKVLEEKKMKRRVVFGNATEDTARNIGRDAEVEEPVDSDLEDELEIDQQNCQWEEELIRRGGHQFSTQAQNKQTMTSNEYPTKKAVTSLTVSEIVRKLEKRCENAIADNERAERDAARLESEIRILEKRLESQKQELAEKLEEHRDYQEIEAFVKGLSFCLREKSVIIETEEKLILEQRTEERLRRDQEMEQADLSAIHYIVHDLKVEPKHFSHSSEPSNYMNKPLLTANGFLLLFNEFIQQMDSTSQLTFDSTITGDSNVFDDVIIDLSSLDLVYSRFYQWKKRYPKHYASTYCDMLLPKFLAPYVAAEMLTWNPLTVAENAIDWSSLTWVKSLTKHEKRSDTGTDNSTLIQSILHQVVLPKLKTAVLQHVDAFSRIHCNSICSLTQSISSISTVHTALKQVFQSIFGTYCDKMASKSKNIFLLPAQIWAKAPEKERALVAFNAYNLKKICCLVLNGLDIFIAAILPPIEWKTDQKLWHLILDSIRLPFATLLAHAQESNTQYSALQSTFETIYTARKCTCERIPKDDLYYLRKEELENCIPTMESATQSI